MLCQIVRGLLTTFIVALITNDCGFEFYTVKHVCTAVIDSLCKIINHTTLSKL